MSEKKKKLKLKAPNAMLILVIIVLASAIASYVVPAGLYDRVADPATGRMLVNPDTFHYIDQTPIGFFEFFESLTIGLQNSGYIIFFLLIIGGVFGIMDATGALHVGMANLIKKMAGKEILLVPICMVVFGLGSACAGNFEEFLAFFQLMVHGYCMDGGGLRLFRRIYQRLYSRSGTGNCGTAPVFGDVAEDSRFCCLPLR